MKLKELAEWDEKLAEYNILKNRVKFMRQTADANPHPGLFDIEGIFVSRECYAAVTDALEKELERMGEEEV